MGIVSVIDEMVSSSKVHAWAYTTAGEHGRPAKGVAIVACMDARINVESMFGLRTGDAHIIRNAGGIVTDDVLRSLLISQRLLGTREILLLHHTACGGRHPSRELIDRSYPAPGPTRALLGQPQRGVRGGTARRCD